VLQHGTVVVSLFFSSSLSLLMCPLSIALFVY